MSYFVIKIIMTNKNSSVKYEAISRQTDSLIFISKEVLRNESVKLHFLQNKKKQTNKHREWKGVCLVTARTLEITNYSIQIIFIWRNEYASINLIHPM